MKTRSAAKKQDSFETYAPADMKLMPADINVIQEHVTSPIPKVEDEDKENKPSIEFDTGALDSSSEKENSQGEQIQQLEHQLKAVQKQNQELKALIMDVKHLQDAVFERFVGKYQRLMGEESGFIFNQQSREE